MGETFMVATWEGMREIEIHHSFTIGKREFVVHKCTSEFLPDSYTVSHRASGYRVGGYDRRPGAVEKKMRAFWAKRTEKEIQRALRRARQDKIGGHLTTHPLRQSPRGSA